MRKVIHCLIPTPVLVHRRYKHTFPHMANLRQCLMQQSVFKGKNVDDFKGVPVVTAFNRE